jgi:hypothetical protein
MRSDAPVNTLRCASDIAPRNRLLTAVCFDHARFPWIVSGS